MAHGIEKRIADKGLLNLTPFRGAAHKMHRKDGAEGVAGKDGKVSYADLGHSYDDRPKVVENRVHYPGLHIDAGKLPDLAEHKIGEELELKVKAKIRGAHKGDDGMSFDLDVTKAALV